MGIKLDLKYSGVSEDDVSRYADAVKAAVRSLDDGTCRSSDYLGWRRLPYNLTKDELDAICAAAEKIRNDSDVFVVIGIGGSYLGSRALIEALGSQYFNEFAKTKIYFAGNNICGDELNHIVSLCKGKRFSVNVISKSGTTTEPAVAFRVLKKLLEEQFGEKEAATRIYATTDANKGTLKAACSKNGYSTFVIPDDVGGRFSVLTAVGLLPVAVAGFDIKRLIDGAKSGVDKYCNGDLMSNDSSKYAVARNILHKKDKPIEILASYEPAFARMNGWWTQLFAESEGKDGKGIFPTCASFSTDLHSIGQYIQDGTRNIFETVVWFGDVASDIRIEREADDFDSLNYLAGKTMSQINENAFLGTLMAHVDGGVPNMLLRVEKIDEFNLGELIYFFENAVAVSGLLLGINPFDQPGVEAYKKNMFALLGKPGYEGMTDILHKKLI